MYDPRLSYKQRLLMLLFFIGVTLIYTVPLVQHLWESTAFLGLNYPLMANASFIGEQLARANSPLTIDRVLVPTGYTIHEGFLPSLQVCLLGAGQNFMLGLNLSLLSSFLLAGIGAFLLAWRMTGSYSGSLTAGFYYGFSAQHYANLGTYPIAHLEWLPFFLLGLYEFGERGRKRHLALLTASFLAASLSSWYFAVFIGVLTALYLPIHFLDRPRRLRLVVLIGSLAAACLLLLPFSPGVLLGQSGLATGGFDYVVDGSADLLSFFVPPFYHWYFAASVQELQDGWQGNPSLRANYLGTFSLLLALAGLFSMRKRDPKQACFLLLLLVVAFILALGPFLTINGLENWSVGQPTETIENLKLPYYWLADLFPFSATRAVSRFSILAVMALSIGLAFSVEQIQQRFRSSSWQVLLPGAVLLTLALELWPVWPLNIREEEAPSDFYRELATNPDPTITLMELPLRNSAYRVLYLAAAHQRKVIGGAIDKPFARFREELLRYPYLRQLILTGQADPHSPAFHDVFGKESLSLGPDVLQSLNVRYAVLHKWDERILSFGPFYQPEPLLGALEDLVDPLFEPHFEDRLIRVLVRPDLQSDWLYPVIGRGWGAAEDHGTYTDRPLLGQSAEILIRASTEQTFDLELQVALILVPERDIWIKLNEERLRDERLTAEQKPHVIRIRNLRARPGWNTLEIGTPQPPKSIAEIHGGSDRRPISLLLRRLSIQVTGE